MTHSGVRVLYLSYTGVMEPLGSQIHPVLESLSRLGHRIDLVTWEKSRDLRDRARVTAMRKRLTESGVSWLPLRYHKRPTGPATLLDVGTGLVRVIMKAPVRRWDIVHVRSYVPGAIALVLRRLSGARFLFDMRGFWADEYVDVGTWDSDQAWFRRAKHVEQALLRRSDTVVVLTHEARRVLLEGHPRLARAWTGDPPPVRVIPTCTDTSLFQPRSGPRAGNAFVIGYVGSIGTWYEFESMARTVAEAHRHQPDIEFLVVTRTPEGDVRSQTRAAGLPDHAVTVAQANRDEVPALIARMHLGLFFITPVFSKLASCATKMGEFLSCGVPVVTNRGIGDSEQVVTEHRVGTVATSLDSNDTRIALSAARRMVEDDPTVSERCRNVAMSQFDLQGAVVEYDQIYRSLRSETGTETDVA